jgi:hypothetical protein
MSMIKEVIPDDYNQVEAVIDKEYVVMPLTIRTECSA